jgi:hypothetical protein
MWGTPVTFTAAADGATVLEILEWTWTPADTTLPPGTAACGPGINPCVTAVQESGTMEVRARVDGQERVAEVGVAVGDPGGHDLSLVCTATVERAQDVRCDIVGSAPYAVTGWRFTHDAGGWSVPGPSSGSSWAGEAAVGGSVQVAITFSAGADTLRDSFVVSGRNWPWKQNTLYEPGAASPAYDGRDLTPLDPLGWTCNRDEGCPMTATSRVIHPSPESQDGYQLRHILDGGPNNGVWYVEVAWHSMMLGSNVNPFLLQQSQARWPAPGCSLDPANTYEYNECQDIALDSLILAVKRHEDWHGAVGMEMADVVNPRAAIEDVAHFLESQMISRIQARLTDARDEIGSAVKAIDYINPWDCPNRWYGGYWYRGSTAWGYHPNRSVCYQ